MRRRRRYRPHKTYTPKDRYPYIARGLVYGLGAAMGCYTILGVLVYLLMR